MKKILMIFVFILIVAGCGSKQIPAWKNAAYDQLEDFKTNYLIGRDYVAELHFHKAIEEIKKSGDLDLLAIAYLTKYALAVAVLEDFDDGEYLKIDAAHSVPEHQSFRSFLAGELHRVDRKLLPAHYRSVFAAYRSGNSSSVAEEISKMREPLSTLVAAGFLVRQDACEEECLKVAIETASQKGWKKAVLAYLEELWAFYEINNEDEKAEMTRQKIELLSR
jgi:hypothetical protein